MKKKSVSTVGGEERPNPADCGVITSIHDDLCADVLGVQIIRLLTCKHTAYNENEVNCYTTRV